MCRDFVVMRVAAAALAWPDVTMATGEYPVPIARPYVLGQEAVGVGRGRVAVAAGVDRETRGRLHAAAVREPRRGVRRDGANDV